MTGRSTVEVVAGMRRAELEGLVLEANEIMGKAEVLLAAGMEIMVKLAPEDSEVARWCCEALTLLGPPEEILAEMLAGVSDA